MEGVDKYGFSEAMNSQQPNHIMKEAVFHAGSEVKRMSCSLGGSPTGSERLV